MTLDKNLPIEEQKKLVLSKFRELKVIDIRIDETKSIDDYVNLITLIEGLNEKSSDKELETLTGEPRIIEL